MTASLQAIARHRQEKEELFGPRASNSRSKIPLNYLAEEFLRLRQGVGL